MLTQIQPSNYLLLATKNKFVSFLYCLVFKKKGNTLAHFFIPASLFNLGLPIDFATAVPVTERITWKFDASKIKSLFFTCLNNLLLNLYMQSV